MDINASIELPYYQHDIVKPHNEDIALVTNTNPIFTTETGDTIYMGDNDDIFGIYIGKDSPLMPKILDLIYNTTETEEIIDTIIDIAV